MSEVVAVVGHGSASRPRPDTRYALKLLHQDVRRQVTPVRPVLEVRFSSRAQWPALERQTDAGELLIVQAEHGFGSREESVSLAVQVSDPLAVRLTEIPVQSFGLRSTDDLTDNRGCYRFPQIGRTEPRDGAERCQC